MSSCKYFLTLKTWRVIAQNNVRDDFEDWGRIQAYQEVEVKWYLEYLKRGANEKKKKLEKDNLSFLI